MELTAYFKHFMNTYRGLDDYLVEIDGQTMHEWNYEDGCLFVGASKILFPFLSVKFRSALLV